MWRSRFLKSTPFRLALTFALFFVAAFLVAGVVAYLAMADVLTRRLDRQTSESFAGFEGLYENSDTSDIISAVAQMASASSRRDRVYIVQSADGTPLAGNIEMAPPADGWVTLKASALGIANDDDLRFRVYSGAVGDLRLTVGASLEATGEILETALLSFGWATLAVVVFAVAGGLFLAYRAQRRIELIGGAMDAIGDGNLDARIPITRANDDLDYLSAQINAALDNLKRLVEGMRQVSADIAHDLKTPINRLYIAIEALLEKANRGTADAPGLEEALSEASQINETFDALLRITQIEAGARRSRFTEVDLRAVLDTVFDAYEPSAVEQGRSLALSIPERNPCPCHGDGGLLLQMVANLVENGIRHTPPGTEIRLACEARAGGLGSEIVVSDSGPGIPEVDRERVFQRLYRLEKSRTTPGSGLGLSLVKAIADLHGATITLSDNAPGLRVVVAFPPAPGIGTR